MSKKYTETQGFDRGKVWKSGIKYVVEIWYNSSNHTNPKMGFVSVPYQIEGTKGSPSETESKATIFYLN